jgi:hypothetical protein
MNFSMRSAELSILCLKIQYKSQGKRMLADNAQAIHNVTYSTYWHSWAGIHTDI